jgi:AraC-like DNA-binding protein
MYQIIKPPEILKNYIECFWWGDNLELPQSPNIYHSIASSKIELLFFDQRIYSLNRNGKEESIFTAGFYGQSSSFGQYFASAKKTTIFGITFSPLAALKFFNIPANELTNERIEINSLLGSHGNELSDKIFEAPTFHSKAMIAANFFCDKLKDIPLKYLSVENLILSIDKANLNSIPQLVTQSFLSQRQFERNFKELTGFSAKTYLKIKRFERFIDKAYALVGSSEDKLIDLAFDLGYCDQAHLNRHFKELSGLNPKAYFKNSILQ